MNNKIFLCILALGMLQPMAIFPYENSQVHVGLREAKDGCLLPGAKVHRVNISPNFKTGKRFIFFFADASGPVILDPQRCNRLFEHTYEQIKEHTFIKKSLFKSAHYFDVHSLGLLFGEWYPEYDFSELQKVVLVGGGILFPQVNRYQGWGY